MGRYPINEILRNRFMKLSELFAAATVVALCAILTGCKDEAKIIPKQTYGIITSGNSALRIDPLVFASKILQLNKGESVEVIERSKEKTWVAKSSHYWYRVRTRAGYSGWVYGENLQILTSRDRDYLKKVANEFLADEAARIKKELQGKWWSINEFEDFTSQCLELHDDGSYRSYFKGQEKGIEGQFKVDMNANQVIFDKGTTFKGNLDIVKRGQEYILRRDMEDHELRFKRISIDVKDKSKDPNVEPVNPELPVKQDDPKETTDQPAADEASAPVEQQPDGK